MSPPWNLPGLDRLRASLLFSYVANYIYDGDAPLAERRAQALSIDQSQLEELLGDTDLRELLDPVAIEEVQSRLQMLDEEYHARHEDGIHDMLLRLGDLTAEEIAARTSETDVEKGLARLTAARRLLRVRVAGETRYIPVEYAARYRDAFGIPLPPGLPEAFLRPTDEPLQGIARRSRARMDRSLRSNWRIAPRSNLLRLNLRCERSTPRENCWKANSFPKARIANGAILRYCSRFGARAWPTCGAKLNRWSRKRCRVC